MRVFNKINEIKKPWSDIKLPDFLCFDFLNIYYKHHPSIKHLFFIDIDLRLYAHIFKIRFNKTGNYLSSFSFSNLLLKHISFDVLYLTNSFITNIPAFISKGKINLEALLSKIEANYSLIIIPDFVYKEIVVDNNEYVKVEVEEEMVLYIRDEWDSLTDYISALRRKYRAKVKNILKQTAAIQVANLDSTKLIEHRAEMQELFNQLVQSSRFQGPSFNIDSFVDFVTIGYMRVDGYFLEGKLVGFSSEIEQDKAMYSYFVGFDQQLNQSTPIYGRILIENISNAIKYKKNRLILGRTANEYKSNFGAIPIKSSIYLKIKNQFLNTILKPVYTNIKVKEWKQRHPFR